MSEGKFIVLDGPDGCGKSTQAKMLAETLAEKYPDRETVATREPGGTAAGEEIRNTLLRHYAGGSSLYAETEVYLFFAARAQLMREVIGPAVDNGKIVICERWVSSTLAYQGYAGNVPVEVIERTGALAIGGVKPDLLIVLDVPAEEGLRRIKGEGEGDADRIEAKSLDYHEQVRSGFREIAKRENNAVLIPAGGIDETRARVLKEVERVI